MAIITQSENMIANNKDKENINKEISYDFSAKIQIRQEYLVQTDVDPKRTTFQKATKLCILIGQCFGLNPVLGIGESDTSKLRFVPYSFRCMYTFTSIMLQVCVVTFCVVRLSKDNDPSVGANSNLVFYLTNSMTTIVFLRIATKWPSLCQQIAKYEAADPSVDPGLVKTCNYTCILVLSLALLEHILSDISGIVVAIDCRPDTNLLEAFNSQSFPWAWTIFNYSHALGMLVQLINFQCTFNWSFADLFVICISMYLTSRLKQINDRILSARGKYVSSQFWRTMREDYCKATNLVRKVDDVISGIILISFANNLFFICLQFLHILEDGVKPRPACGKSLDSRPLKGFENPVYFIYSFAYLLSRSVAVSLIAAKVHTASKMPAETLYDVPSASYCVEVQRFIDQIHGDTVALSGLQFFHVKRGLVLTVAGTIVTYELVLMQFAGVNPTSAPPILFVPQESFTTSTPEN